MTLSMRRVLDTLNEKKENIDLNDLGFVLTVFRDNVSDDEVHEILDSFVHQLWEKTNSK